MYYAIIFDLFSDAFSTHIFKLALAALDLSWSRSWIDNGFLYFERSKPSFRNRRSIHTCANALVYLKHSLGSGLSRS